MSTSTQRKSERTASEARPPFKVRDLALATLAGRPCSAASFPTSARRTHRSPRLTESWLC